MGQKLGAPPPFGGGELGPHLAMWPGSRPACTPSFILIHPTVWPQYTNVTDRQDRQTDRQTDRQRCDSTGRTVLQLVAQKVDESKVNRCSEQHSTELRQNYAICLCKLF